LKKYKEAETKSDKIKAREDMLRYARTLNKTAPGAYKRMNNAFVTGMKISHAKNNVLVGVMYEKNPEVQARIFYEIWDGANDERKESLIYDAKKLGIYSKRFVRELNRLKTSE